MPDARQRFEVMIKKLRNSGYKITPQRFALVKLLSDSKNHPSVEDLYGQLRIDFPTMSLATVYRNVLLIKSLGEVLELGFPEGKNRYDGKKPYPHPHLICTRCKRIMDMDWVDIKEVTRKIEHETGFEIRNHRMDFFGICAKCMKDNL